MFRTCFLLLALAATAGFAAGQAPEEVLAHPHGSLAQGFHWSPAQWPHGDTWAQLNDQIKDAMGLAQVAQAEARQWAQFNDQIKDAMGQYKDLLAQNKSMEWVSTSSSSSYLGVGAEDVDSSRAKELKLKEERGVEIRRVDPDSPAEKAGLKEHDVVLEYNGQRVEGMESFVRMVRETPVGRPVKLLISRDGNTQALTATIGRRKTEDYFRGLNINVPMPRIAIDVPRPVIAMRTTRMGVETESLSGQLAEYFGVKEGVLVRSVEKESPAEKAGLKAGDVIVKADGQRVRQPRDLTEELRFNREKKNLPLEIIRNRKEMTLNLELPERAGSTTRGRTVRFQHDRL